MWIESHIHFVAGVTTSEKYFDLVIFWLIYCCRQCSVHFVRPNDIEWSFLDKTGSIFGSRVYNVRNVSEVKSAFPKPSNLGGCSSSPDKILICSLLRSERRAVSGAYPFFGRFLGGPTRLSSKRKGLARLSKSSSSAGFMATKTRAMDAGEVWGS